jgi:hypothetical protein
MVIQNFPQTPDCYDEAAFFYEQVDVFGLFSNNELVAAFIFGQRTESSAFLDVVCAPGWEKRWASRHLLRALGGLAFEHYGLKLVWAQTHCRRSLRAALQAGFVPITPLGGEEPPTLVITPRLFRYDMNRKSKRKGEKKDGIFISSKYTGTAATTAAKHNSG